MNDEDKLRPIGRSILEQCANMFGENENSITGDQCFVCYHPANEFSAVSEITTYTKDMEPIFGYSEDDGGTVFIGDYCTEYQIKKLQSELNL